MDDEEAKVEAQGMLQLGDDESRSISPVAMGGGDFLDIGNSISGDAVDSGDDSLSSSFANYKDSVLKTISEKTDEKNNVIIEQESILKAERKKMETIISGEEIDFKAFKDCSDNIKKILGEISRSKAGVDSRI